MDFNQEQSMMSVYFRINMIDLSTQVGKLTVTIICIWPAVVDLCNSLHLFQKSFFDDVRATLTTGLWITHCIGLEKWQQ